MHSWHDVKTNRLTPTDFIAVIEISKGSKNKYELDKETGHLIILEKNKHEVDKFCDLDLLL